MLLPFNVSAQNGERKRGGKNIYHTNMYARIDTLYYDSKKSPPPIHTFYHMMPFIQDHLTKPHALLSHSAKLHMKGKSNQSGQGNSSSMGYSSFCLIFLSVTGTLLDQALLNWVSIRTHKASGS